MATKRAPKRKSPQRGAKGIASPKTLKKGDAPRGGGGPVGGMSRPSDMDSAAQNILQLAKERHLEAVEMLTPRMIEGYKMKDGKTHDFDKMLKMGHLEPERAGELMVWIANIMRSGMHSLTSWARADHVPKVRDAAQRLLADIVRWLVTERYVKLTREVGKGTDAFAIRWSQVMKKGRGISRYAAIRIFPQMLLGEVDRATQEILDNWGDEPGSEPKHVQALRKMVDLACTSHQPGEEILHTYVIGGVHWLLERPELLAWNWQNLLWPLTQRIWPAFSREHEHFTGWGRHRLGRPLSERKRQVDEKTDFAVSRWKSEIKGAVEDTLEFRRLYEGT